jgi:hypothetical protein
MAAATATATATATAAGHVHHQQPLFRVVGTALVAPAAAAAGPRSIPLTFFDVKWLHLPPVERVLLYRLSPDADVPAILSALRTSLSQALRARLLPDGRPRPHAHRVLTNLVQFYCSIYGLVLQLLLASLTGFDSWTDAHGGPPARAVVQPR